MARSCSPKKLPKWLVKLGTGPCRSPLVVRKRTSLRSFNDKLKGEHPRPEIFYSLPRGAGRDRYLSDHYNRIRPHSALNYRPPAPVTLDVFAGQLLTPTSVHGYVGEIRAEFRA